jgi:multidrug resistance efflux pump
LPDNKQEQNPEGELEGLIAEKDKEQRIAELEQALADKDEQLTALTQSAAEMEQRLAEREESLAQAIASYRALAVRYNPGLPKEQIAGDSIEEIDASLARAQALINRLRQELEAEMAASRIPAGAPLRAPADLSALSPRDKIQYAIGERR